MTADEFPIRCSCGAVDDGETFKSAGLGDTIAKLTKRLGIRKCGGCSKRQATLNRLFPYRQKLSAKRCDVLNCYPPLANPEWIKLRGDLYARELNKSGLDAKSVQVADRTVASAAGAINKYNPRVFVNHAFFFSWETVAELSAAFPKTNFLTINHSSQADLARSPRWLSDQAHFVELAQQRENCFLATVDPKNPLGQLDLKRCLWVPNLVNWPRYPATHKIKTERPIASVVCRYDPNKAIPHSILGAAMSGRVDLLFMIKNARRDQLTAYCQSLGVSFEFVDWSDWDTYTKTIGERVSLGLQPSFSESFNYVSIEHMALGVPVGGSPAIRFLPLEWKANPDDPRSIAATINAVLADYEKNSKRAVRVAGHVQQINRAQAERVYKNLANKRGQ